MYKHICSKCNQEFEENILNHFESHYPDADLDYRKSMGMAFDWEGQKFIQVINGEQLNQKLLFHRKSMVNK